MVSSYIDDPRTGYNQEIKSPDDLKPIHPQDYSAIQLECVILQKAYKTFGKQQSSIKTKVTRAIIRYSMLRKLTLHEQT